VDINRAEVVAELTAAFQQYEKALAGGDNEALVDWFWADPALVRFGLGDQQYGFPQLRTWRLAQPAPPAGRRLFDTVVTAFGPDFGVVSTGFDYPDGSPPGRQSQTWLRTASGWRIVHAHVSTA
jgi:hypothetical protein